MNLTPSSKSSHFTGWLRLTLGLALLLILPACQSTNRLREAQDAFNSAASQDNRARLAELRLSSGAPGLPAGWTQSAGVSLEQEVSGSISARAGYSAALLSLQQLSSEDVAQLKADQLWGTALTLKALTQWRLGQFGPALETVRQAQTTASGQIYPRDAALLTALPGLIEIDYSYASLPSFRANPTNAQATLDQWRARLVTVGSTPPSAVDHLRAARRQAGAEGELAVYLMLSELAAYRNFNEYFKVVNDSTPPATDAARMEAGYVLHELGELLNQLNAGAAGTELVTTWKNKFVLLPKPRPVLP